MRLPWGRRLDDVRARTGASRSQLYHYLDDRDDLIRAVSTSQRTPPSTSNASCSTVSTPGPASTRWFNALVQLQARGGRPIGSLAGQLAAQDGDARDAIDREPDRRLAA